MESSTYGRVNEGEGEICLWSRGIPIKRTACAYGCKPGLTVLIIYNTGAGEIFDFWNPPLRLSEKHHFANFQKTYENPMDFKHFCFRPNSLRELSFFFVTRIMLFELSALFLSYACARFNMFFFCPIICVHLSIAKCAPYQVTKLNLPSLNKKFL